MLQWAQKYLSPALGFFVPLSSLFCDLASLLLLSTLLRSVKPLLFFSPYLLSCALTLISSLFLVLQTLLSGSPSTPSSLFYPQMSYFSLFTSLLHPLLPFLPLLLSFQLHLLSHLSLSFSICYVQLHLHLPSWIPFFHFLPLLTGIVTALLLFI